MMAWTGRELAKAQSTEFAAQRLLGDDDPELVPQPLAEIDDAPADHAMDGRVWAVLDRSHQGPTVRIGESRWLTGPLAVDQPVRTVRVQLQNPITNDLERHTAGRGRLRAARTVIDRSQRQKTAGLACVLAPSGSGPQLLGLEIAPQRDRHGEPPSFATLNQTRSASRNTDESHRQRFGITHHVSILTMNGDSHQLRQSTSRPATARVEQNQATDESAAP